MDYRLFQNDIFAGFRYSFNDINSKELKVGSTIDLKYPEDVIYMAELTGRFKEVFTYAVRVDGVSSRSESRLDTFKEELRLKMRFSYNFNSE